ncbi:PREDICTED: odorant receptor 63a-like [Vollenhovia emeryi]|uniref:odorant receptor 63a-like n=1 Tax=Vollenhovia emeryi TaxID=411798 RepID=UPI0005F53865|nr:PREDICTED: odorant receptor 63a-like [Vollenhovia emeryi]
MEFPEDSYFKLNRVVLSAIGLWPYDDFKVRHFRFLLSLLIIISFISPQLLKLLISEYSLDLFLNMFCYNIIFVMLCAKYISFYAILKNIKEFRDRVRNNWDALKDNQEIEIICKHENRGKVFTIFIIVLSYTVISLYIFLQCTSVLLDIVMPLNESRPRELIFPAEYFIDQQKYFYILTIHVLMGLFFIATSAIATESFSLANALHAFGLFNIASYRMKNILIGINRQRDICLNKEYAISCNKIIAAVDFHRRAIEFSELLKESFGPMYLILFMGCVCSAGVGLSNLSRIIMMEKEIVSVVKYSACIILTITGLALANYAGQEFINCDTDVYRAICNTKWYNASLKTQKLVLFLIQKTTKCYKVDAGGMFSPCLEGLATALSMSVSYFMVLHSSV